MTVFLSQQIAVFFFLFLLLVVGFFHKRSPKTTKEYALGSDKISTPVLMATMVATVIGAGSVIGHSSLLYQNGLWLFFTLFAMPVGYCIMALVIVPKLSKYYGCLSIVEIIGKMYGNYARKTVGVVAFLFCLGILGIQIKCFYWVMRGMFVDNALLATIIGISIVTLYSAMGGASSVIKASMIQFFVFIVIVPLVANYIIQTSGGIAEITATISKIDRPFFHNGTVSAFIALAIFYLAPDLSPNYLHRLLVGKDCKKNQAATYSLAFVYLLTTIFLGCVAFIALSKFPNIRSQDTLSVVIKNLLPYEWAIVAFTIALVSIIVSTADALINTSAIILTHDVFPSKITEKQKINLLRGITILSGILAIVFVCFGVLDLLLFVSEYYAIIVIVPFIAGLFVKETRKEPFWASAVMGVATFTIVRFTYNDLRYEAFLVGLVSSLLTYLSVFFALSKEAAPGFSFSIRRLCDRIVEKHAIQVHYLGWIVVLFFMLSMFLKGKNHSQFGAITFVECITGVLGFSLLFIDKSALKYKNVIALFIMLYCFAFSPAYVFLHQETDNSVFTMSFIGSIVLLAGLFSWDVFLSSVLSGSFMAVLVFYFFGPEGQNLIGPVMYLSLLLGVISLMAAVVFRKRDLVVLEFVEKKLKASNDIDQALKQSEIYNQILRAAKVSLEANDKYRDVLLNEDETIMVSFSDLKDNMLAYFQQTSVEARTKLTIANTRHKILNTGLPLSFFYKTIYSVIANVFNCNNGGEIVVRFCCNNSGKIGTIEISHGPHKVSELMRYFRGPYPENILGWNILTKLFDQLEIKVTEGSKKLRIIFPSETKQDNDNILYFKECLQSMAELSTSG